MTQVKSAQGSRAQVASTPRATARTLAQRRADLEAQMRSYVDRTMALSKSELPDVSDRLKDLRDELARERGVKEVPQYQVAGEMDVPPRTFQSWENGEVEPRGEGYGPLAEYYSEQLGRTITKNWIMFGQDDEPAPPQAPEAPTDEPAVARELRELRARVDEVLDNQSTLLSRLDAVLAERALPSLPQQPPAQTGEESPS